ncbi:MAG: HAD-IA family hydrolase [Deltaproteobacteria bacterium]|nr:HAD-IA family hydrolase [Deltaproteobacteria bacterium]
MDIQAVSFDAGNTLIRPRTSVGEVYAAAARRHGVSADGVALDRRFREVFGRRRSEFLPAVSRPHSPGRERAFWRTLVAEVFRLEGLWETAAHVFEAIFHDLYEAFARPDPWEVFPDVGPCLDALQARGVPVVVVSNWDSRLHEILLGLGLRERFRFVLVSAEFGAEKPDPAIFHEAARRLGKAPDRVLHVGDLYREDVLGARAAGMVGALVDRQGDGPPARVRFRDLREIPGYLG